MSPRLISPRVERNSLDGGWGCSPPGAHRQWSLIFDSLSPSAFSLCKNWWLKTRNKAAYTILLAIWRAFLAFPTKKSQENARGRSDGPTDSDLQISVHAPINEQRKTHTENLEEKGWGLEGEKRPSSQQFLFLLAFVFVFVVVVVPLLWTYPTYGYVGRGHDDRFLCVARKRPTKVPSSFFPSLFLFSFLPLSFPQN